MPVPIHPTHETLLTDILIGTNYGHMILSAICNMYAIYTVCESSTADLITRILYRSLIMMDLIPPARSETSFGPPSAHQMCAGCDYDLQYLKM